MLWQLGSMRFWDLCLNCNSYKYCNSYCINRLYLGCFHLTNLAS